MKKISLTFIVLLFLQLRTYAQTEGPPSLSLGLTGLSFGKGTLDPELIASIIADKQGELKKEFVQRYILRQLNGHSYALWEFSYNSLDALLNTKDKKIIQKRLLESASNLALVYVFSEGYLNASRKLGNEQFFNFLSYLSREHILENVTNETDTYLINVLHNDSTNSYSLRDSLINIINGSIGGTKNRKLGKVSMDSLIKSQSYNGQLKNLFSLNSKLKFKGGDEISLNEFLIDYFYDKLKGNEELARLGFFKSWKPLGEDYYNETSLYKKVLGQIENNIYYKDFDKRVSKEIDLLLNNYYLAEIINSNRVGTLKGLDTFLAADTLSRDSLAIVARNVSSNLYSNIGTIPNAGSNPDTAFKTKYKILREDVVKFTELTDYLQNQPNGKEISITDLYYSNERIYKAIQLIAKYCQSGCLDGIKLDSLMILNKNIAYIYLQKLKSGKLGGTYSKVERNDINEYSILIELIQRMHKLDVATTYDYVLNSIKYFGENILDKSKASVLNTITCNMEKYALIDKDANTVSIKSEEIIEALYNKYGETTFSLSKKTPKLKIAPYFTVGASTGSWIYSSNIDTTLLLFVDTTNGQLQTLKSLSMVSEKIGIKFMYDFKAARMLDETETLKNNKSLEPFVHDAHFLLFASGILYNITNTTTKSNFKYPLIGVAAGLSFFNGLDVNLFYSAPIVSNEKFFNSFGKRAYIGASFDFKIIEYLAAIRKKRAESKTEN